MIKTAKRQHAGLMLAAASLLMAAPVQADAPGTQAPVLPVAAVSSDVVLPRPLDTVGQVLDTVTDADAKVAPPIVDEVDAAQDANAYKHIGEGVASYYGHELAGNRTANGERFNPMGLTAAHRSLPMGSKLRVTNQRNGKSVIVRINDRGPFVKSRIIDVSLGAARQLAMTGSGTARVRLEMLR